jgi:HK97 family phage prohead protease
MPKDCWDLVNYLKNPVICRDHCWSKLVGGTDVLEPREEGLYLEAIIGDPSTGFALTEDQIEARSLIAQGFLKAMSVGFIPWDMKFDEELDLLIHVRAELLEVSLVTIPMQQESMFNVVKGMLLRNDPITIGGQKVAGETGNTGTEDTGGTGEDPNKPEDEVIAIVNKVLSNLENNTKLTQEMHAKILGGTSDNEKALQARIDELTAELEGVKAEKAEIEKSAEQLLALVERK